MTNQINQEIIEIRKQSNADYLRKHLKQCEDKISRLASEEKDGKLYFNLRNEDRIVECLEIRRALLNRLFELNYSETNFQALEATNNQLVKMEKKALEAHRKKYEKPIIENPNNSLHTLLIYRNNYQNPQLIIKEDDDFYGSRWNNMIEILYTLFYVNFNYFYNYDCWDDNIDSYKYQELLEIDLNIPNAISFCFTFRGLSSHQHYSIPDIMRMTTYYICQDAILNYPISLI